MKSVFRQLGHGKMQLAWLLESQGDPNDKRLVDDQAYGIRYGPMTNLKHARLGTRELLREVEKTHPDQLTIHLHALATRILFGDDDPTCAVGIEYLAGPRLYQAHHEPSGDPGEVCRVYADKEVIVAGGAFNTPQLLMLSGIGPKEHLAEFDIESRVELDGVGKNLQDRYEVSVVEKMKRPWKLLKNVELKTGDPEYKRWARKRKGVYSTNGSMMSVVFPSDSTKSRPDLFILAFLIDFHGYFKGYAKQLLRDKKYLSWTILKAYTRNMGGRVSLVSNDPKVRPHINFHYFDEGTDTQGHDLKAVVDGIDASRKISHTMRRVVDHEVLPGGSKITRQDLEQFVKDEAWGHHACGTCGMKPREENGVVDSKFRVYGTKNLRVVDASIFPRIPGFFIVTSIYVAAEKAASDIVGDAV